MLTESRHKLSNHSHEILNKMYHETYTAVIVRLYFFALNASKSYKLFLIMKYFCLLDHFYARILTLAFYNTMEMINTQINQCD